MSEATAELANRSARVSFCHAEAEAHPLYPTFRLAFVRDTGRVPTDADVFDAVNAPDVF